MIISVINQTHGEIADPDLLAAIRAINQQIEYDFAPYWNMGGTLRLEGALQKEPHSVIAASVMRGDAVLYASQTGSDDPEGFHDRNIRRKLRMST